jgi:chromate transporter
MVTQFVGYLAGVTRCGAVHAAGGGTLGALVTTWVTFAPCFLWIFTFAPWLERLEGARRLKGGVGHVDRRHCRGHCQPVAVVCDPCPVRAERGSIVRAVHLLTPVPQSLDWHAALLAALSAVLIFRLRWNVIGVLVLGAVVGVVPGPVG